MKKFQLLALLLTMLTGSVSFAQDKPKPASPPASVTETIASGSVLTINYHQPSLKGRVIGESVEPMRGKVWRMGANNATVFSTTKDVKVNGQALPAGKYSIWGLLGEDGSFTIIFNKDWSIWGTEYEKHKQNDVLKIVTAPTNAGAFQEMLTYTIAKSGKVTGAWGEMETSFMVE